MVKYSKDGKVIFDPEKHTYLLGNKYLKGVTSFISEYKNKFDSDKIAEAYAKKYGRVKEEVLAEWEAKAKYSCDQGTAVHNIFEDWINKKTISPSGIYPKEKIASKFIKDIFLTGRLEPVESEYIVYNEVLASQIDLIARNKAGDHFIFDWKTNDKISKTSFNDQRMLPPFSDYPDCSFYHYSLQVTLYEKLCIDYDIKGSYIVHIGSEDYSILKAEKINLDWL